MFCIGSVFLRIMYARNEVISIDFFFSIPRVLDDSYLVCDKLLIHY